MGTASDEVVSVQIQADVAQYVDGMKAAAGATTQAMDGIKASTQAAGGAARDSLGRFVAGAKDAADAAKQAAQGVAGLKDEVGPLGDAAKHGSEGMFSLGGAIKEYRKEVRTEGRYGKFLAGDIASMGLASKGAAMEVTSFISAFAFGGGLGVAIESVKLLVKFFNEADDSVKKIKEDGEKSLSALKDQIADIVLTMSGATKADMLAQKSLRKDLESRVGIEEEIAKAQAKSSEAHARYAALVEKGKATQALQASAAEAAADKEVANLQRQLAEIDKIVAAKKKALVPGVAALNTGDASRAADEAEKAAKQHQAKLLQIETEGLTGADKLQAEYVAKIQAIGDSDRLTTLQKEEEKNAELMAYQRKLTLNMEEELKKQAEIESQFQERVYRATLEAQKKIDELNARNDKAAVDREKRLEKFNSDQTKSYIKDFIGPVSSASAGFFKGVLLQQENVGDAIKGLMVGVASAVIDGLVKRAEKAIVTAATETAAAKAQAISTTQGNIAMAATGAASAVAATPWVGPALAAAAFAETTALLEAGTAPMLSAAGGLDRVPRDGTRAILHAEEMVWPAQFSDGARNMLSAFSSGSFTNSTSAPASSGGGETHLHFHNHFEAGTIVDQQTLNRHYQSPEVQQAISRAVRMGKWEG